MSENKKSTCALILGGEFAPLEGISQADLIVACDKGYGYARDNGIEPGLLVGDFDSYKGRLPDDINRLELPVEKDDTDTMAAVRYAIDSGYKKLLLYCALGGRLDHLIGNLQAAAFAASHGASVKIYAGKEIGHVINNGCLRLKKRKQGCFSLLSLSDACEDVSIIGAKYSLNHAHLTNTFPIGVSNEWADDEAVISVGSGVLLILEEADI